MERNTTQAAFDADALKNAGIDYERGVKRFMGRSAIYEKALRKFPADGTFMRICAAYEAGDEKELFANVHEFKGMCGNIALASLYEAADMMVALLRAGSGFGEELASAYALVCGEYQRALDALLPGGTR